MRKSAFLDELQSSVCAVADAELARVGRNTQGCPYIENWIGYYRGRTAQQVERALRRYAPEAGGATSARQYIPSVAERIRRAVSIWARTGQITGVPEELAGQLPGAGVGGAVGRMLSGIGSVVSGLVGGVGRAIGGIFAKSRDGSLPGQADPQEIQSQLGEGQPLDAGVRSKMEPAFGHDFSRVRVHADGQAADLSTGLNARAFTIGTDVAFGAGEYRPGTLVGDALIAHELAHVLQQRDAGSSEGPLPQSEGQKYTDFEADADASAAQAMASLWGPAREGANPIGKFGVPRAKSRLGLQRCAKEQTVKTTATVAQPQCPTDQGLSTLKTSVKGTFGFAAVEDGDSCWNLKELTKVKGALEKVPPDQRSALTGVTLKRVKASTCPGSEVAGCFKGAVDKQTAQRGDVLEIADDAFAEDKEIEDQSVAKVKEYDLAGKLKTTLPSERTVLHEVGHGVETSELRPAEAARFKADIETTGKQESLKKAITRYNDTSTDVPAITFSNAAEKAYVTGITSAGKALKGVIDPINDLNNITGEPTYKAFKAAAESTGKHVRDAEKAIADRDKARKRLRSDSTVPRADVESGQDANLAASKELLKALEARRDAQKELESTQAAEASASAKITIGKSKETVSRRLAELVALISLKGIDIKNSNLRSYIKDNWPDKPGEAFADFYQMSVTEQEGLKTFDPDIAEFFKEPIGPKAKWKAKVEAWITSH